jgi:hypothetical protein
VVSARPPPLAHGLRRNVEEQRKVVSAHEKPEGSTSSSGERVMSQEREAEERLRRAIDAVKESARYSTSRPIAAG